MKRIFLIMALAVVTALAFSSCDNTKDKPANPSSVQVSAGLKTALMKQGFKFDTNGALVVDSKVKNTKELDLSGSMLKDFKGLSAFPNLKSLVLRNNSYYPSFDFSILPPNIDAVDLRDNNIFIYNGLVSTKVEDNGDETTTILHKFKKLYLPNGAKDNLSSVLSFYLKNKDAVDNGTIDMQMQKKDGSLEKYSTIREVPDVTLRKYLKDNFSDIFVGDKIDISKRLSQGQAFTSFTPTNTKYAPSIKNYFNIEDLDGAQYVVNNKSYKASSIMIGSSNADVKVPNFIINESCNNLYLCNLHLENVCFDTNNAKNLSTLMAIRVSGIKTLELENSMIGVVADKLHPDYRNNNLIILGMTNLEEIHFPKNFAYFTQFVLFNTPKLAKVDLSNIEVIQGCQLSTLSPNVSLTMPKKLSSIKSLGITKDIYDISTVKEYIDKDEKNLADPGADGDLLEMAGLKYTGFHWYYEWKKEHKHN